MASPLSILKSVLNLNHNRMHVTNCEQAEVTIHRYGETHRQTRICVHVRPYTRVQKLCPVCRKRCPGYDTKSSTESSWRAPNLNGVPVYICYRPNRIECSEHGILTEYIPWADGTSRFTEDFNNEIAWMACRMSKTCICQFEEINWRTVGNCIRAAHSRLEPDISDRMHDLHRICVDETSYRKGYAYITVVYDMDRNRAVWIHEGNGLEVFRLFCEELPSQERSKIEIIAGDGAQWIDQCVEQYFPNATRCIDFFHVAEWANEKLDLVRTATAGKAKREYEHRREQLRQEEAREQEARDSLRQEILGLLRPVEEELASYPKKPGRPCRRKRELLSRLKELREMLPEEPEVPKKQGRPRKDALSPEHQEEIDLLASRAKDIKRSRYALGHNPENCTEYQTEKIKLIENSYPDLYRAYQLKETLRLILHMKDAELAEEELDKWIEESASSGLAPMEELSAKILRHRENILNSIRCQANSAKSEAVNTTIKVLIKMARGFRNIENMIALIYLKCSDLVIPLFNRVQMTAERAAAARNTANELRRKRKVSAIPA
jgi:transposase